MIWQPVDLLAKPVFDRFHALYPTQISELNFTNLFLWGDAFHYEYCVIDGFLLVRQQIDKKFSYLSPMGEGDLMVLLSQVKEAHSHCYPIEFHFVPNDLIPTFQTCDNVTITPTPDRYDYVYNVSDLIELSGRVYHDKKNWINRFTKQYQFTVHEISKESITKIQNAAIAWCSERNCDDNFSLSAETNGILKILYYWDKLDIKGVYLDVEGEVAGFTISELLNPETALIHIEKAGNNYQGAYQTINQQNLIAHWSHVPYVNRECDLAIPGLRKAKQSYNPAFLVEKSIVRVSI